MAARKKAGSRRSKKATTRKKPAGAARKKSPARRKKATKKMAAKKKASKKKAAKKASKKKAPARKAPARKAPARKAPRRKAARGEARKAPAEGAWALALAGDWNRGAFLAGALDALHARGVGPFPLVAGSGSGALVAAFVALDRWDAMRRVFRTLEKRQLLRPRYAWLPGGPAAGYLASTVTRTESLFDVREGLVRLVRDHIDVGELAHSPVEVHFATVDLQSGVTHSFDNRRDPPEQLFAGLIAAASRPVLMPPVRAGYARHQHAEGTLRDHGPLKAIFRTLARTDTTDVSRLLALSTDAPPGNHDAPYREIEQVTERTVRLLGGERAMRDVQRAQLVNALLGLRDAVPARTFERALAGLAPSTRAEVERHLGKRRLPIVHLHPPTPAAASVLDLDPAASRAAWDAGVAAAERWLG
jgi:predicted acylesterase/phospholipase RssA